MSARLILITILALTAIASGWMMNRFVSTRPSTVSVDNAEPDYYMEDFTTITIGENGLPLNTLHAVYMEHNPLDDSLKLTQPRMEVYRDNNEPLYITSDNGLVTDNNEVVFLQGAVRMWEQNSQGETTLNVVTSEVRVLVLEEYAETDQNATITDKRTTITGRGVRAHFKDSHLEILDHEQTVITQPDSI